jgi:hypothetical protein
MLHPDDRGRVSAPLASERQVAEEGVLGDVATAKQEWPRDVSDAPTGAARSPQMTVALSLCLGDRPGPPILIDTHDGQSSHGDDRRQVRLGREPINSEALANVRFGASGSAPAASA